VIGTIQNPAQIAMQTMDTVLGGSFTSRLNMNLREDKHWSYGAFSKIIQDAGPSVFFADAPVQTDKTKEAVIEMDKEFKGILASQPITDAETELAKSQRVQRLPGSWETQGSVVASIANIVRYNRPDDYYQTYAQKVTELTSGQLQDTAKEIVHPEQLTWIVIGDRAKIEPGLRELGWGDVQILNADGEKTN
jgi:zinc protease